MSSIFATGSGISSFLFLYLLDIDIRNLRSLKNNVPFFVCLDFICNFATWDLSHSVAVAVHHILKLKEALFYSSTLHA